MRQSEAIGSLVAALAKAQQEVRNPPLDSVNPHFRNRYASLGAHLEAVREPFAKNGLVLMQSIGSDEGKVTVTTTVAHSSGEWISGTVGMPLPDKATAQNLGSIVTYLRRYSIGSMCLLTGEEDTDAEQDRVSRQDKPKVESAAPKPAAPQGKSDKLKAVRELLEPHPSAAPKKESWPKDGIDLVMPTKMVERGDANNAVLFSHPVHGNNWVAVSKEMSANIKLEKRVELSWRWNAAGFTEAVEIRSVPKLTDMLNKEQSHA